MRLIKTERNHLDHSVVEYHLPFETVEKIKTVSLYAIDAVAVVAVSWFVVFKSIRNAKKD